MFVNLWTEVMIDHMFALVVIIEASKQIVIQKHLESDRKSH